ncbi:MAG: hydroxyisourate hydrolase [Bacteroidia bacterium]
MSQLSTHILDTSIGKPAEGVRVALGQKTTNSFIRIAEGITNSDGRISDLLPKEKILDIGIYQLIFNTAPYFEKQSIKTFYPKVIIEFEIADASHYHVPLLINPYGYTTYRGS